MCKKCLLGMVLAVLFAGVSTIGLQGMELDIQIVPEEEVEEYDRQVERNKLEFDILMGEQELETIRLGIETYAARLRGMPENDPNRLTNQRLLVFLREREQEVQQDLKDLQQQLDNL